MLWRACSTVSRSCCHLHSACWGLEVEVEDVPVLEWFKGIFFANVEWSALLMIMPRTLEYSGALAITPRCSFCFRDAKDVMR